MYCQRPVVYVCMCVCVCVCEGVLMSLFVRVCMLKVNLLYVRMLGVCMCIMMVMDAISS